MKLADLLPKLNLFSSVEIVTPMRPFTDRVCAATAMDAMTKNQAGLKCVLVKFICEWNHVVVRISWVKSVLLAGIWGLFKNGWMNFFQFCCDLFKWPFLSLVVEYLWNKILIKSFHILFLKNDENSNQCISFFCVI